jgi:hypothetical protein
MASHFFCPHAVIGQQRVGDDDQFAHDDDLGGFAGLAQIQLFRLSDGLKRMAILECKAPGSNCARPSLMKLLPRPVPDCWVFGAGPSHAIILYDTTIAEVTRAPIVTPPAPCANIQR